MPHSGRTQKENTVSPAAKLRIAFITYKFGHQYGGAEAYGVELVRELAKRHEITVIAYDYDPHCALVLPFVKISVSKRWPSWIRSFFFARQSAKITAQGDFDLVHSQMNGWNGDLDVLHVRSVRYRWFTRVSRIKRWFNYLSPRIQMYCWLEKQRVHTKPPRRTIVVSEALKNQLQQAYKTDYPFDVITPGVRLPLPDSKTKQQLRTELGIKPEDYLCLLVARTPHRKGLPTLLKALSLLPKHIKVIAVGATKQELPRLHGEATAQGLQDRVIFVPQTTEVSPYYQMADLCVHPTLNDSFGMAPLEAMSHDLPVIMSNAHYCGFAQYVTHQQEAWLLQDPTNPVELSQAISKIATETELAQGLRQRAQQLLPKFNWSNLAAQYEQIYADILADPLTGSSATPHGPKGSMAKNSATKRSA